MTKLRPNDPPRDRSHILPPEKPPREKTKRPDIGDRDTRPLESRDARVNRKYEQMLAYMAKHNSLYIKKR